MEEHPQKDEHTSLNKSIVIAIVISILFILTGSLIWINFNQQRQVKYKAIEAQSFQAENAAIVVSSSTVTILGTSTSH